MSDRKKTDQGVALLKDIARSKENFDKDTAMKLKDSQRTVADIKRRLRVVEDKLSAIANLRHDVTTFRTALQDSQAQL